MVEEYSDKETEEILDRVYEWGIEFSKSHRYEALTEEQKQESKPVIMSFTEYMYSYHGLSPEEWDEDGLEECCLDTLPRKVSADKSYFKSIAPVLSAFFVFAEEKELLRNTLNLAERVKEVDEQIIKNASDSENRGPAKSFVMAAKDAGVDITNEKEMNFFMFAHNLYQLALMEGVDVTDKKEVEKFMLEKIANIDTGSENAKKPKRKKIGRNDPCPCGSGKKYKKCCGQFVQKQDAAKKVRKKY